MRAAYARSVPLKFRELAKTPPVSLVDQGNTRLGSSIEADSARDPGRTASLKIRNYRLYFFGQLLSQPGTYVQTIGQSWLVLHLTNSGADLGIVLAAQYLPVLFLGAWGGVLADRFDNRKIMVATQSTAGCFALLLGILVLTGEVRLWMVMVLAAGFGFVMVADSPARQSFASEMVGPHLVANAIALSMILNNIARVVGPSIGAALIAFAGIGWCFVVNGVSYFAVVAALLAMDRSKIHKRPRAARQRGELRAGFAHIASRPVLRDTLIMLGITGCVGAGVNIMMPLLAQRTFHGDATTYALMATSMGIGAVLGGVFIARSLEPSMRAMAILASVYCICIAVASVMPAAVLVDLVFVVIGASSTMFTVNANATLQRRSDPEMRGRVMALWAVALLGTQPIAAPVFGILADRVGPRLSLTAVAVVAAGTSIVAIRTSARESRTGARISVTPVEVITGDVVAGPRSLESIPWQDDELAVKEA
jgi:MFS family permease